MSTLLDCFSSIFTSRNATPPPVVLRDITLSDEEPITGGQAIIRFGIDPHGRRYALKCPKEPHFLTIDLEHEKRILTYIQTQANHPNCIHLYGSLILYQRIVLVLEYVPGVTLHSAIAQRRLGLSFSIIRDIAKQVLYALQFLQSISITHGDVNPNNILVTGTTVKLCDFGAAFHTQTNKWITSTTYYSAPEAPTVHFQKRNPEDAKYADSWGLGATLYKACTKRILFTDSFPSETFQDRKLCTRAFIAVYQTAFEQRTPPPLTNVTVQALARKETALDTERCIDLLGRFLQYTPQDRILPEQALGHPFFSATETEEMATV